MTDFADTSPPAHRVRSEQTWAKAREAYAGGLSGPEVCERFDLGLSALRLRARNEGWRRSDQEDPGAETEVLDDAEALDRDPDLSPAELAELAWKRARRATLRGRLREAQGWARLHRDYRALVAEARAERERAERNASRERLREADAMGRGVRTLTALAKTLDRLGPQPGCAPDLREADDGLHRLHELHAVSETPVEAPAKPPPNRAARRVQARIEALKARQAARAPPDQPPSGPQSA